jgi:hypothetical protein
MKKIYLTLTIVLFSFIANAQKIHYTERWIEKEVEKDIGNGQNLTYTNTDKELNNPSTINIDLSNSFISIYNTNDNKTIIFTFLEFKKDQCDNLIGFICKDLFGKKALITIDVYLGFAVLEYADENIEYVYR